MSRARSWLVLRRCGAALEDRVARKRMRIRMAEIDGKENRHGHGLTAKLGGNEMELLRALHGRRVERSVPARLLDPRRVCAHLAVTIDSQPQCHVALHLACIER